MPQESTATNSTLPAASAGIEPIHNRTSFLAEQLTQWVDDQNWVPDFFNHTVAITILLTSYFVFDSVLNSVQAILSRTPAGKRINLATFIQVAKLLGALVVVILSVSILVGTSPLVLLGGLGVFASVFMLVFKDVILGFVAGIQLASNRMLTQGDWLEMPSYNADGDGHFPILDLHGR